MSSSAKPNKETSDIPTVVDTLQKAALAMELLGENPFKIRAYINAAAALETLEDDLDKLVADQNLDSVKGIGKGLAEKISSLRTSGHNSEIESLLLKIPEGIFEILQIPGLGPKKVKLLWDEFGITTIGELEYACNENRLAKLKGFGEKSQNKILSGIKNLEKYKGRRLRAHVVEEAEELLQLIAGEPSVIRAEIAGSYRRSLETVKDIDIVASSTDPKAVMDAFVKADVAEEITGHGETKSSIRTSSGLQVDLRVVTDEEYPHALQHFTGSKEHNTELRRLAKRVGLKINEYGLFEGETRRLLKNEAEIYDACGLTYIPPELREGAGEIKLAEKEKFEDLLTLDDIKGIFHCHTTASDGKNTLMEMAIECEKLGYSYLGVSDHSVSAFYAGGLTADDLAKQSDEIDKVNDEFSDFKVLKGVESDILADGSLDYSDSVLDKLDFVIASVHSGFVNDEARMTDRLVTAIRNRYTTMLGHMTGRLLLSREGYPINVSKVIEACAENNVIIELNANPHRLDIDWRHIRAAISAGVMISINPDAHRLAGFAHTIHGVLTARKGGARKENVFNTRNFDEVKTWLKAQRK